MGVRVGTPDRVAKLITVGLFAFIFCLVGIFVAVIKIDHDLTDKSRGKIPMWEWPARHEQVGHRDDRNTAVTNITTGVDEKLMISTTFSKKVNLANMEFFPEMYYKGPVFGVSAWNPEGKTLSDEENHALNDKLLVELESMDPLPDAIFPRHSGHMPKVVNGRTTWDWHEHGFAVHFRHTGNKKYDELTELKIKYMMRKYGQTCFYKWWPNRWGGDHPRLGITILQSIVPVTPAVQGLSSHHPAYIIRSFSLPNGVSLADYHTIKEIENERRKRAEELKQQWGRPTPRPIPKRTTPKGGKPLPSDAPVKSYRKGKGDGPAPAHHRKGPAHGGL